MTNGELQLAIDTVWVIVAACMVFLMQAGFAMLEIGFGSSIRRTSINSSSAGSAKSFATAAPAIVTAIRRWANPGNDTRRT